MDINKSYFLRVAVAVAVLATATGAAAQSGDPGSRPLRVVTKAASDLKIYLNPGHGGWDSGDRPMESIPYPKNAGGTSTSSFPDTCGFYESNTDLWKMIEVRERLIEMGVPDANIKMSRWNNGPYPRDGVNYHTGDNFGRSFSVITAEVNAGGYDMFLSIHSNGTGSDHTLTNYDLTLFRQRYDSTNGRYEANPPSSEMGKVMWPYHYMDEIDPHSTLSYSNRTTPYVVGDLKFYGSTTSTGYLGVLKHNVPGFLMEGFFHTYDPAKHRALNEDYCRQEGARVARGIAAWFSIPQLPTGDIMGTVKDKSAAVSHSFYKYFTDRGDDMYKPVHGAHVTLYKGDTFIADYCTDDLYNGVFVFEDLTPGSDYYISVKKDGYANLERSGPYTVTAAETTYPQLYLTAGTASGTTASDLSLELTREFSDLAISQLQDKTVRRVLQRDDYLVVLAVEGNATHTPHLYRIVPKQLGPNADPDGDAAVTELSTVGLTSTAGNCGSNLYDLSDIAFTADGYLIGCNALKTQSSADQVESGTRGVWRVYKWNSLSGTPSQWFTTSADELSSGHFYRADVGLTMAYNGTVDNGWIMTPCVNAYDATSSPQIRDLVMHVVNGSLAKTYTNYDRDASANRPLQSLTAYGTDVRYLPSPKGSDRFIVDGNLIAPLEKRVNTQDALAAKVYGTLPQPVADVFSNGGATLTAMRHHLFVTPVSTDGATNAGISIYDISSGLKSALTVTATNTGLDAVAFSAIGATGGVSGSDITFHLLRDGKLSRWTTAVSQGEIDDPDPEVGLELQLQYSDHAIAALSGKTVRRALHTGGSEFVVLAVDGNRTPYLYKVDADALTATPISTTGVVDVTTENNQGSSLYSLSDIALTSDGKLIAVNQLQTQDTENDAQIESGKSRGYLRVYRWDDLAGDPVQWFASPNAGFLYKALVGGSIAYTGSSTAGQLVVSAVNDYYGGASNTTMRYDIYTISGGSQTGYIYNRQLASTATKASDAGDGFKFSASPRGAGFFLLDGPNIAPLEIALSDNGIAATINAALPVSDLLSNDPHPATLGSQTLLISPYSDNSANKGIRLYDISSGLADATIIDATDVTLADSTPAYVSATACNDDTSGAFIAWLVRDNTFAKWSTAAEEPVTPPVDEGIGIYAYGLRQSVDSDDAYTFSFNVNTSPLTATLIFSDPDTGTELGRYTVANPVKGANSVTITQDDLPFNEGITAAWAVNVTGYPVTEMKKLNTGDGFTASDYDFTRASVAVDRSPESEYFGSVYVTDLHTRNAVKDDNTANRDNGVYRFNPLWQRENTSPYTGQMAWDNIFRLAVDYKGRLYIPDFGDNHSGVYLAYPDRMSDTWQNFFAGSRTVSSGLITNSGVNTGCSSPAVSIAGTGASTKLYASLEDFDYNVYCYDLGANMSDGELPDKWYTAPAMVHQKTKLTYVNNNVIAQDDGAVWVSEVLYTASGGNVGNVAATPALRYITPAHDDYWSYAPNSNTPVTNLNGCTGGGFAISNDGSWLVIVDGDGVLQFFDIGGTSDKPILTWSKSLAVDVNDDVTSVTGGRVPGGIYQMAFDYGGNLYVAGGALGIYSMPNADNQATTPAMSGLTVTRYVTRTVPQLAAEAAPGTNYRLQDDMTVAYVLPDARTLIARSVTAGEHDQDAGATADAGLDYIASLTSLTDGEPNAEASWVAITLPEELTAPQLTSILGKRLGNVYGTLTDVVNPTIAAVNMPATATADEPASLNVFLPTSFGSDHVGTVSGREYFFLEPKPCEVAVIYWAMWDGTRFVTIPAGTRTAGGTANGDGLTGGFDVDMSLYEDPSVTAASLETSKVYNGFTALVHKTAATGGSGAPRRAPGTGGYLVYPLSGLVASDIVTGVTDVDEPAVVSVERYDLSGRRAGDGHRGIVIEVTTLSDGTTRSRKIIQ